MELYRLLFLLISMRVFSSFSKVTSHDILGKQIFIKRDELNFISEVNGNKSRKLKFLINELNLYDTIVSYGGVQSNAMSAIGKIVRSIPNKKFIYITKKLPKFLLNNPSGNLKTALDCNMKVCIFMKNNTV